MAFALGTHFLLFLWFSGVNHLVHPSTEAGSGMEADYYPQYQQDESRRAGPEVYGPPSPHFNFPHPQVRRLSLPPSHVDPLQDEPLVMRRQYRLEDFLWTGSGDGPHPSEQDGGLAWEDNGGGITPHFGGGAGGASTKSWIIVTRTTTLYRTVPTTIYPVEMTPTVISAHAPVSPTPRVSPSPTPSLPPGGDDNSLSPSPSESEGYLDTTNVMWIPTPTFSPTAPPEATAAPPEIPSPSPPTEVPPGGEDNNNILEAASTDPVYWIQTSIKANNSAYRDTPRVFQQRMQKSLASVYASAFKRHLLATLGVLPPSPTTNKNNQRRRKRSRRRRSAYHSDTPNKVPEEEEEEQDLRNLHQWFYVAQSSMSPSQLKQLATAAMNVTVTLINVTEEAPPKVDLRYVVLAEGTPVPAFSAVKELELVSKREMEEMLGYEIINKKAEALVAGPPEQMTRNEQYVATSPWLIVAVTTMCLLVILLALIGFMVWKWKHNRLGDAMGGGRRLGAGGVVSSASGPPARPQSGTIREDDDHDDAHELGGDDDEEGVVNPAFTGTPRRTGREETLDQSPKSSPAQSLLSARHRARTATKRISEVLSRLPSSSSKTKTKAIRRGGDEVDVEVEVESDPRSRKLKGKREQWHSPSSSEDLRVHKRVTGGVLTSSEGSADWKELLGEPKPKMTGARKRSPVRGVKGTGGGVQKSGGAGGSATAASKEILRRRRKKSKVAEEANLRTDFEGEEEEDDEEGEEDYSQGEETEAPPPPKQQQPWTKGITDAISLGNLDIFQDSAIAQTPSEYARKLVPWKRPGSAVGASSHQQPSTSSAPSQPYFLPRTATPGSRIQTIEEIPSFDQQDRDISERSESPPPAQGSPSPVDTKECGVQTPTRISKTASHKQRAAPKPRKTWSTRGSPGGGGESSVISTESEEIVEVHHVGGGVPEDQNPLGRMRKRFHQFLDDAFNVMVSGGGRQGEEEGGGNEDPAGHRRTTQASTSKRGGGRQAETQSAKVSISHEVVETETEWRPWTSHVVREETLQKLRRGARPKSAAVPVAQIIGPPKPAWTASSERRTHSAKGGAPSRVGSAVDIQAGARSTSSTAGGFLRRRTNFQDKEEEDDDTYDKTSTREDPPPPPHQPPKHISSTSATADPQSSTLSSSHSQSLILSPAFIFPQYPAYPDIRVTMGGGSGGVIAPVSSSSTSSTASSSLLSHKTAPPPPPPPPPSLPPNDPAVPLIQAIKDEMKRFEKEPTPGGSSTK